MSENEDQPTVPSKQTSSVPLKKETVRVILKAADAPPAVPSATVRMAPPVRPPVPTASPSPTMGGGAPRAPAPARTVPLRTAGPPSMAPAPTIRLASAGAAGMPTRPGAPTIALPTSSLPKATLPTSSLPKATLPMVGPPTATVQLQKPTVSAAPGLKTQAEVAEEEPVVASDGITKIVSIVGFIAALIVLSLQLMTASTWINAEDHAETGSWSRLF